MYKKIHHIMTVFVVIALAMGSYFSVSALAILPNTYYVSVDGNDANACMDTNPCKTFAKAISLAQPGDIVHVFPGTYAQQLIITKSDITVESDGAVISIYAQNGISVSPAVQNVIIRGFTVTGTKSHAIFIEGKFVTIENNIVHNAILENGIYPNCGNGQWGSAIKAERGSSDLTIQGNQVFNNCGEGIASTMSHHVNISGNTVYDNHSVNIYVDNSYAVNVTGNTVYCTKITNNPGGIVLGEEFYTGWGAQLKDVTISNNVVTNCSTGILALTSGVGGTLTNVTISNNLVPSGQIKGVSLDNDNNLNIAISKNIYYNAPWVRSPAGVTLAENVIGTQPVVPATNSPTPLPTITSIPSITPVNTLVPASPTVTSTPIAATPTLIPVSPTATASMMASLIPPTNVPTNTPTSKPTVQPTATVTSQRVYDDMNKGLIYSADWKNVSNRQASGGSYKTTTKAGSAVSLKFTGQAFSILYAAGPSYGNVNIYIDGKLAGTIYQNSSSAKYQQRWDYSGNLPAGSHVLKLVTKNISGRFVSLDAVIVR